MNSTNYLTVTEFREYNPELDFSAYSDTTISGMIQRASGWVDDYLQYSLGVEDISNETSESIITSGGNLMIYTQKIPIQSVSAITIKLGTISMALNLTDSNGAKYEIPSRGNYILYPYQEIAMTGSFTIRNFYQLRGVQIFTRVSYRAGYDTIPANIKDAVNLVTKDIFIRQANPMDLANSGQGAINMTFRSRSDETGDSTWMKQAKQVLQDYKRVIPF